ncbi:MAG: hypothetical protein CMJ39_03545 [Phycisphaerae bacterium]|nr:hypothetical protein [Phycisphaerae bacterium]
MTTDLRITPMFKLLPILLMSLLASAAVARAEAETATDSIETTTEETMADYLNHANTMYWVSRARPWSLTEVKRSLEFYDLAEQMIEHEPLEIQAQLKLQIEKGRQQVETMLDERSEQLGSWSPYYGLLFGQDEIYEWYDNPVEIAAERIASSILDPSTRLHMENDQPYMIIQTDLGDLEEEHGEAARDVIHVYINNNKPFYAISEREIAANLNSTMLEKLQANPPDPDALKELASSVSSDEMTVDSIGIITITHNDSVEGLCYLGGYYQKWPTGASTATREWYVDGFAEDVGFVEAVVYLLLLLGLLWQPLIVGTLRSGFLDKKALGHTSRPPVWSMTVAVIGGFAFSAMAKAGLSMATPDLEMLHPTSLSIAWIAGSSVILLVLPILLVYVTTTRFNSIATRLGNVDMVAILLAGSWYGAQINLLLHAAPIEGLGPALAMLSLPALLGSVTLVGVAHSYCLWNRSGSHWDAAATTAGILALTAAAIIEVRGTWPASILAGCLPPATYLLVILLKTAWNLQRQSEDPTELQHNKGDLLRNPPFIDTTASTELFNSLLEDLLGDAASDDAIEIAWLEGDRGCGKTRIAKELAERITQEVASRNLADETIILFGDCNEPGDPEADVPYEPLRQAFSQLMGVERFGNPAENARKMQEGLSKVASNASVAGSAISVALDLAGSDDESFTSANEGMIADEMTEILGNTVKPDGEHPGGKRVVLIIDDIQWIDDDSNNLLNILLERLVEQFVSGDKNMQNRVCLLITSRTDIPKDNNETDKSEECLEKLEELQNRGVANLIRPEPIHSILGSDENSLEWRDGLLEKLRCMERARRAITSELELKGLELPLHRLEFIKIALEQHALKTIDGRIDLDSTVPLHEISAGKEFKDMVANELKGLDRRLLDILQCCAVIGRSFHVSLVAEIFEIDIIELLSLLKEAEEREIIFDQIETDGIYEFRDKRIAGAFRSEPREDPTEVHQMVREYHRRFVAIRARELDAKYSDETLIPFNDVLAIATHAAMVAENMPMETIRWSRLACAKCRQRRLYGRAIRELQPALNLIKGRRDLAIPSADRIDLFLIHAELLLKAEQEQEIALDSIERAETLLNETVDPDEQARHKATLLRGLSLYQMRKFSEADAVVQKLLDAPSPPLWMKARARFIKALCMDPSSQAAEKHETLEQLFKDTSAAIDQNEDPNIRHQLILLQSEICNSLGQSRLNHAKDTQGAEDILKLGLELNRSPQVSDRKGEAIGHSRLGDVYVHKGMIDEARESYGLNLSISRETGDLSGIIIMTSKLGQFALDEADSQTDGNRTALINEGRRCYEESALVAIKNKRTFSLGFAIKGLIRVEAIEGTSGAMLIQTIEEAIAADSMDTDLADTTLAAIEEYDLPEASRDQIRMLLKPFSD